MPLFRPIATEMKKNKEKYLKSLQSENRLFISNNRGLCKQEIYVHINYYLRVEEIKIFSDLQRPNSWTHRLLLKEILNHALHQEDK